LLLRNLLSQTPSANLRAFSLDLISKSEPDQGNLESANIRERESNALNPTRRSTRPQFLPG